MKYHICIPTDEAIKLLAKGKNPFEPASPEDAMIALMKQRKDGKPYFTGCGNEGSNGMCNGHAE